MLWFLLGNFWSSHWGTQWKHLKRPIFDRAFHHIFKTHDVLLKWKAHTPNVFLMIFVFLSFAIPSVLRKLRFRLNAILISLVCSVASSRCASVNEDVCVAYS